MSVPPTSELGKQPRPFHVFTAYCDEHGKFYYHGPANGYCPVRTWRWGRWMTCNHRGRAHA